MTQTVEDLRRRGYIHPTEYARHREYYDLLEARNRARIIDNASARL